MDESAISEEESKLRILLADTFRNHGIECQGKDNILIFPDQRMAATVQLFDRTSGAAAIVQLDVALEIGLGKKIIESCAGFGTDIESATVEAWDGFLRNSFHVLLSAFFTRDYDDQINRYEWTVGGCDYEAVMSQISVRGRQPEKFPLKWLDQFEDMVKQESFSPGTHWIRLYYAQSGWEMVNCEILLDNADWTSKYSIIQSFEYPASENFFSVRIFLVLKDRFDVSRAASTIAWLNNEDDEVIDRELIKEGMTQAEAEAEKARVYIPLAFGRVFLKGLTTSKFSDEAVVVDELDHKTEINLNDEPIYTEAYKLGEQIMKNGCMNKEYFQLIFTQSSEFNAYNNALLEGAKPEDLDGGCFQPPVIFLSHYLSDVEDDSPEFKKPKKNWKFWKKK